MLYSNYLADKTGKKEVEDLKKKVLNKTKILDKPEVEPINDVELEKEVASNKPAIDPTAAVGFVQNKLKRESDITGGSYTEDVSETSLSEASEKKKEKKAAESSDVAGGVIAGATGVLDMVATEQANKDPLNKKQRQANTMNMAMKGAQTGAAVGSVIPGVGTLIGAGVGALASGGYAMVKHKGDEKTLDASAKRAQEELAQREYSNRMEAQKINDAGKSSQKKKKVQEAQSKLLGNYK